MEETRLSSLSFCFTGKSRQRLFAFLVVILLIGVGGSAHAFTISYTPPDSYPDLYAGMGPGDGQSFTMSQDGYLDSLQVKLESDFLAGTMLNIYETDGTSLLGSPLYSQEIASFSSDIIELTSQLLLSDGQQYSFIFDSASSIPIYVSYDDPDQYTEGESYWDGYGYDEWYDLWFILSFSEVPDDLAASIPGDWPLYDFAVLLDNYTGSNADMLWFITQLSNISDINTLKKVLRLAGTRNNPTIFNQVGLSSARMYLSTIQSHLAEVRSESPAMMASISDNPAEALSGLVQGNTFSGDVLGFASGLATMLNVASPEVQGYAPMASSENSLLATYIGNDPMLAVMAPVVAPGAASSSITINPDKRFGVFAKYFAIFGSQDAAGGSDNGYTYVTHGVAGGVDYLITDWLLAGVTLGYSYTNTIIDDGLNSSADMYSFNVGSYATMFFDALYFDASFMAGINRYMGKRRIVAPGVNRTAESDYPGLDLIVHIGAGYEFSFLDDQLTLTPMGGLDYIYNRQDAHTESGAGALNQINEEQHSHSLTSTLGVRVAYTFPDVTEWMDVSVEARALWAHEYHDQSIQSEVRLQGNPSASWSVESSDMARDSARLGAGIQIELFDVSAIFVNYIADLAYGSRVHGLYAGVRFEF